MASQQLVDGTTKSKPAELAKDDGPQAHFEYFKQWADYVNDYALVKKARAGYDGVKHSCTLAESTFNRVESGVQNGLTNVAAPVYANYCYPATDKLVEYYTRGMDTTKAAVDKTVSVAVHTGALSLGIAIVTTQMGLIATTSATNVFLSSLIKTKCAGYSAIQGVQNAEKVVEQRFREAIEQTLQIAKVPHDKIVEHTNNFLDIANVVFDRLLGLHHVREPIDSTMADRIRFLSSRVTGGLLVQANNNVIDPLRSSLHEFVKQMNRNLILADYIKQRREWATEAAENLSASVTDLKCKIETEAKALGSKPEEVLVRSIRKTSALLNENFETLRKQGHELVGEGTSQTIESATHFIEQLDNNFSKAENLYQIRDEVIVEAKLKVSEMKKWTSSLLVRDLPNQQQPTVPSNSS